MGTKKETAANPNFSNDLSFMHELPTPWKESLIKKPNRGKGKPYTLRSTTEEPMFCYAMGRL